MNEIRTKFRATCSRNLSRQRCVIYAPLRTRMRTRRVFFTPEEFPLRVYNKAFLSLQLRSQITRYARFTREMKNPLRVYALAYKSRKKFRFLSQSENAVLPIAGKRVSTDTLSRSMNKLSQVGAIRGKNWDEKNRETMVAVVVVAGWCWRWFTGEQKNRVTRKSDTVGRNDFDRAGRKFDLIRSAIFFVYLRVCQQCI